MASKKGVALTAGIAAAIVGSSFLIWYIPQSSPGGSLAPRTDLEVFNDVYSQSINLNATIRLNFDRWTNGVLPTENMTAELVSAKSMIGQIRQELVNHQPAQEWKKSYDLYVQALDTYSAYLDSLKTKVESGDKTNPDPALSQKWKELVAQSVDGVPA